MQFYNDTAVGDDSVLRRRYGSVFISDDNGNKQQVTYRLSVNDTDHPCKLELTAIPIN